MNKFTSFVVILVVVLSMVPGTFAQDDELEEILIEFEEFGYCFNFEYLPLHEVYVVGDTFPVAGAQVSAIEFEWSSGNYYADGEATVDNNQLAGGWGYDIQTNNINLMFELEESLPGLVLLYGEYGGNVNLAVNEEMIVFDDFPDIDGIEIGGVEVIVMPITDEQGVLIMIGEIATFAIGGQELWIDDPCQQEFLEEDCVTFDPFQVGVPLYAVGDTLYESGVEMTFLEFDAITTIIIDGFAMIDDQNLAGGNDNDLNTNNINIQFVFPRPVLYIRLLFGEYGGNLNFDINGDFAIIDDFADIDGANIGGAEIGVGGGFGNDQGEIDIEGEIETITIGGQELWIDELCWVAMEVDE